jgi:DNA-directed RNA polymerase specialized sigma24 family protein
MGVRMADFDAYIIARSEQEAREAYVIDRLQAYLPLVARYKARRDEYDLTLPIITPVYSDMPKGAGEDCKGDRVADERWWRREELDGLRDELMGERAWILRMAGQIGHTDEAVLIRRYLIGQTIDVIAAVINCDPRTVKRWHRRGIRKIAESCPQMSSYVTPHVR